MGGWVQVQVRYCTINSRVLKSVSRCVDSLCDVVEKNEAGKKKCTSFIDCVRKRFKIEAAKRRFDKE